VPVLQHLPSLPQQAAAGFVQELHSFLQAQLMLVKTRERRPIPRIMDFIMDLSLGQDLLPPLGKMLDWQVYSIFQYFFFEGLF
jgi:hypothetical protein